MNTFQVSLDGGDLFKRHSFKQQPDVHLSPRALQRVDETNDHKSPQLPSNHCSAHAYILPILLHNTWLCIERFAYGVRRYTARCPLVIGELYIKKKTARFFFCRTMWYVLIFQGTQHIFWWPAVNFVTVEHFKAFVRSSNHIPAFVYAPGMREVTTWCTNTPCVME